MPIVLLRTHLRADADGAAVETVGSRMDALVRGMPGFVSCRDYAATDGELLTVVEFEDDASLEAWRNHPEHRLAQRQGREQFFSEYRVQVCALQREYSFPATDPQRR